METSPNPEAASEASPNLKATTEAAPVCPEYAHIPEATKEADPVL